jgi:Ca-activated chloride channel family protein
MKNLFTVLFSTVFALSLSAQTSLQGKVTAGDTGEELISANIVLKKNGVFIAGVSTDFNGNYSLNIDAGTYDVTVSYLGYPDNLIQGVVVIPGQANKLDIVMTEQGIIIDQIVVVDYKVPLIEIDNTTQGQTITAGRNGRISTTWAIQLPRRSTNHAKKKKRRKGQTSTAKAPNNNTNSQVNVRGSRADAADYYIDGIRVKANGSMIPQSEIDQIQVITGGTPAMFDHLSEVSDLDVIVSTKTPINEVKDSIVPDFTNEEYQKLIENDFISPQKESYSTFSIDVDHASYSNMRRYINTGQTPPKDAIRIEEMINYFQYDYPQPENDVPFSITTEVGDCPWNGKNKLLHIGLKGTNLQLTEAVANNLVFLIDVSGSMQSPGKLELIKPAFKLLIDQLRPEDKVAIVTYAGNAGLVLPSTSGADKKRIQSAIDNLTAGGSTAGAQGIQLAYKIALENFIEDGNNRVILATDGDFNVGVSSYEGLLSLIGNLQDGKLEVLADKGNGNYSYIDNLSEAEKVFVTESTGTLYTIAKDVKIQLNFDPMTVSTYRLIGYENRLLEKEDFENDKKDAGELGAGHSVTAIYELELTGSQEEDLVKVKLRYKLPKEDQSRFTYQTAKNTALPIAKTSENFRFAAAVAGFGLLLRNSKYKGDVECEMLLELAENAQGKDEFGYREEFIQLVSKYRDLTTVSSK